MISGLDFAIGEFREMKMQPSVERGLRYAEILGAQASREALITTQGLATLFPEEGETHERKEKHH